MNGYYAKRFFNKSNSGSGIIQTNLLAYFDAENAASFDAGNTTWYDLSGNGKHGNLYNGPVYVPANKGVVFDGVNDYCQIPISSANIGNDYTIDIWFKLNSIAQQAKGIIQVASTLGAGAPAFLLQTLNTSYYFRIYFAGIFRYTFSLTDNKYHNVTYTYKNGVNNVYLDGNLVYTLSITGTNPGNSIYIGNGYTGYPSMNASHLLVYTNSLTPEQILSNYNLIKTRYS